MSVQVEHFQPIKLIQSDELDIDTYFSLDFTCFDKDKKFDDSNWSLLLKKLKSGERLFNHLLSLTLK